MLFRRHHGQRKEYIQGITETKVSKRHFVWNNAISYCAISCENTAHILGKLFFLLPKIDGKFVVSNT